RRRMGDIEEAIADYDQAIQRDPNNAAAYYNRAIARQQIGNPQAAIDDYSEAISISPKFAKAYGNRGLIRYETGDARGAIQDLQAAAELFSEQGLSADYQKALQLLRQLK
ncbi:MAG: tetratricopeptide repeat protein, partial [Cyanobacteriota bacterium]